MRIFDAGNDLDVATAAGAVGARSLPLVLDGAYTFTDDTARFHRVPAPSQGERERVLDTLIARITRTLVRAGVSA